MKISWLIPMGILPLLQLRAQVESIGKLNISGEILQNEDISAICALDGGDDKLLIGSDEGTSLQVLRKTSDLNYEIIPEKNHVLFISEKELDTEGIAPGVADTYYLLGSHSLKRRLMQSDFTAKENRLRMEEIGFEPSRMHLFRLNIDKEGNVQAKSQVNLLSILVRDRVLGRFTEIPGKENGVDIEAIAATRKDATDPKLYLGFRSPVLRESFVPVMVLRFSNPADYELRYVMLDGLGIREMQKVDKGFLIIAGPSGGAPGAFYAYYWDGDDAIPDKGKIKSKTRRLGEIPTPPGGKAEGMAVLAETEAFYDVIVVYDGVPSGAPERFHIQKKPAGEEETKFTPDTDE